MMTTDLTVKESELKITYGPYYRGKEVSIQNLATVKYMFTDLTDIRKYYIRLGFHLYEFRANAAYLDFGYSTLEDFCDVNLGLDKSAVSRCINVYREFNAGGEQEFIHGIERRGSSLELSDKWKDYSYTQLCEMLPLSSHERKAVTPDMTIKQIREYKKKLKDDQKRSEDTIKFLDGVVRSIKNPVASTQPEESGSGSVASTQPKIFSYEKYVKTVGIVQQNYIKSCNSVDLINLHVFDKRGHKILCGRLAYVLQRPTEKNNRCLVIRMADSFDPASYIPISVNQQPDQKGEHNE